MFTPTKAPITRVAAIHDISGFGRCSMTVALPTLSAMGVQCCVLPTAYLSAHTAFSDYTFLDMTQEMIDAAKHWKAMNLHFDALYSGFLGSAGQIDVVADAFDTFKTSDNTLVVVDPVMGDHGKPYKTYTPEMCSRMRELVDKADLVTPNLTEACLLLDRPYEGLSNKPEDYEEWLKLLSGDGKRSVVLTGVRPTPCQIGQVYFDRTTGDFGYIGRPYVDQQFHGTGDLYSSVVVGALMEGRSLAEAVDQAAGFVHDCCELSLADGTSGSEGVRFESLLWTLHSTKK